MKTIPVIFQGMKRRSHIPWLLRKIGAEHICEVGVRHGEHLRALLVECVTQAVAVDSWHETGVRSENDDCYSQAELDAQCASVALIDERIVIDRSLSVFAASHYLDGHFDFVYIDADHTESAVGADLREWWPKVRAGGVLAGHDYVNAMPTCKDGIVLRFGVVAAVNRFVAENGLTLYVDADGDWFVQKAPCPSDVVAVDSPRRVITFSIALDEPLFGPLFREYYGKAGDVVIYDPRITPGLPLEIGNPDAELEQTKFIAAATKRLLHAGYDVVLCPDIDEFLIPSDGRSLREFCETFEGDYVRAQGYQVVHQRDSEPPVDPSDPINGRSVAFRSEIYSKVLITKIPLIHSPGRHYAYLPGLADKFEQRIKCVDPSLDLVHLKMIDFEYDYTRWNERVDHCPGVPRFTREQFASFYDTGTDVTYRMWVYWEGLPLPLKPHWRDALRLPSR
jgi:hypothetical protein